MQNSVQALHKWKYGKPKSLLESLDQLGLLDDEPTQLLQILEDESMLLLHFKRTLTPRTEHKPHTPEDIGIVSHLSLEDTIKAIEEYKNAYYKFFLDEYNFYLLSVCIIEDLSDECIYMSGLGNIQKMQSDTIQYLKK